MISRKHFFTVLLLLGYLSGCTRFNHPPSIVNATLYREQLSLLTHWTLEGKIAIHHANKSDSAALQWSQADEQFDIFLSGPLGAGATRLSGTPEHVTLYSDKETSTRTDDPEHLIEKNIGWELPLDKLPRWMIGLSSASSARFNTDHTLAEFNEQGWQVEYPRYQTAGQWLLPEKIVLTHEDLQVTIVIKHWNID